MHEIRGNIVAECAGEQKAQHRSRGNAFSAFIPAPLPRAAILVWSIAPELLTAAFLAYTLSFLVVCRHS